jgi:uncharacterized membrane protein YkoI
MKFRLIALGAALAATSVAALAAGDAKIGVTRAVEIAERATGAIATDADLDRRNDGTLVYEVELATASRLYELEIDAKSGKVLSKHSPRFASEWARWFDADELRHPAQTQPLARLLGDLERRSDGKVLEVSFDVENGEPRYEVEISTAAGVTDIYLDPRTGQRLSLLDD